MRYAYIPKHQITHQHTHRLMKQINPNRPAPNRRQHRNLIPCRPLPQTALHHPMLLQDPIKKIPAQIQKDPGQQRKMVSRAKSCKRKCKRRQNFYRIQNSGHLYAKHTADPDAAILNLLAKHKQ